MDETDYENGDGEIPYGTTDRDLGFMRSPRKIAKTSSSETKYREIEWDW